MNSSSLSYNAYDGLASVYKSLNKNRRKIKMYELGYCLGIGLAILIIIAIFS